jgi:hypothetical protein
VHFSENVDVQARQARGYGSGSLGLGLRWAALAMLCIAGAGCATDSPQPAAVAGTGGGDAVTQRLAEVTAAAGPEVDSFRFERESSFEPIGLRDVLVYVNPRDAWLLHLDGECRNLDFGPFMKLTSHMHRVSTLTDSVIVRDNPIPCMIREIRPVDTAKIKSTSNGVHGELQIQGSTQH